jgi:hypothetical protein
LQYHREAYAQRTTTVVGFRQVQDLQVGSGLEQQALQVQKLCHHSGTKEILLDLVAAFPIRPALDNDEDLQ